ncbi:hypothetical protein PG989_011878 [Apiospora arundinis]
MASLLSSFWRTEPAPKTAVEIGAGCTPGEAAKGTILYMVEREIRDKLDEDPSFDRLKVMKSYVEAMDFLKRDGTTVNVFFIDECIKSHKPRGPASIISAASRTTGGASEISSFSPSRHTIGSATDSNTASELHRHLIPFQLMTADKRWRTAIARKTTTGAQNYISTKIANQCGFSREPGIRIDVTLKLLQEQLDCSVYVKDIEPDMLLTEALVVEFSKYQADWQLEDYFNESTEQSCRSQESAVGRNILRKQELTISLQHRPHTRLMRCQSRKATTVAPMLA